MADKDDEQILVVKSDIIFQQGKWQGLKTNNLDYYINLIKNNYEFKRRGDMENDPSYQQIIPYMIFSSGDKIFAYKYIKNAGEQRLINNDYQLGVGGHINKEDIRNGGEVLEQGMMREWEEEVDFKGNFLQKKLVGIVNDESHEVEKVHLGLVYHFIGGSDDIRVKETDKMEGKMFDFSEISGNFSHSPWMQIVYNEYLKNLKTEHMIKNNYPGKFIVIEGLDGSGKSAQIDLVVNYLKENGKEVIVTKEPTTESESGRKIKQALKKEIIVEPLELQKLYVQDRKEHLENKVIPALKEGKFVVSSRYAFSTFAYGYSDGLDVDSLIKMNNEFLLPDLTIIVDVSPESCMQRIESRGELKELFEQAQKLVKVNEIYQKLPEMFENIVMINGERPVAEVFEDLKKSIENKLQYAILENNVRNEGTFFYNSEEKVMELEKFAPIFEGLDLSENDRYLVEPFFTNLDKSVFGITFLPPEVIGALCSRTSRAKDDLRVAFLKEFVRPFLEGSDQYSESLRALIDFLHKYPAELIFSNPKARDFYITWLAQFGDDSIAQMAGTHLIYTGISQLAIKQIEDMRVGIAPIEKSTRYVDYSTKVNGSYRYYTDPTLLEMGLEGEYRQAMDNLFETYSGLLQEYMEFLKKKYPSEEEKILRTKAFDTVRLILPVATLSQLALYANGQAFEYMVNRCLDHKLGEVRWTARRAVDELSKVIPAFLRRVDTPDAENYRKYLSERSERVQCAMAEAGILSGDVRPHDSCVKLLEYDAGGEDKVIAGLIFGETHEPFENVLGKVKQLSSGGKEKILHEVMGDRKVKYYKTPRAFEKVSLRFEILMNIGAWRDLHRHRIHTQMRQRFTISNGFDVPDGLKEAGLDARFISAVSRAEELFRKVERIDKDVAQYCCCLAHRVRFLQYQNLRQFFWEAELRTIPQGHPDYRRIEQEKARQVSRAYPLLCKYLLVDMNDYDFARRGDSAAILRKEEELRKFFQEKSAT